jgi:type VI secretion system secreted protein Hcp
MALFDAFLKLDGIPGESTDHKHKDEIQLESFSWGASNTGISDNGSGGKLSLQDFSFTAKIGVQSPKLFEALANQSEIRSGTLTVTSRRETEMVLMLGDIHVSGYKESLALPAVQCDRDDQNAANNAPTESVSLNFTKIEFKTS